MRVACGCELRALEVWLRAGKSHTADDINLSLPIIRNIP